MIGQKHLPSQPEMNFSGPMIGAARIPVEWSAVSFECSIQIPTLGAQSSPNGCGPVRLRVSEAFGDYCRLEIYCGEAGLCGASAGS